MKRFACILLVVLMLCAVTSATTLPAFAKEGEQPTGSGMTFSDEFSDNGPHNEITAGGPEIANPDPDGTGSQNGRHQREDSNVLGHTGASVFSEGNLWIIVAVAVVAAAGVTTIVLAKKVKKS